MTYTALNREQLLDVLVEQLHTENGFTNPQAIDATITAAEILLARTSDPHYTKPAIEALTAGLRYERSYLPQHHVRAAAILLQHLPKVPA